MNRKHAFKRALPVWEDGRETDVNHRLMLEALCPSGEDVRLSVSGHTGYRVFVNGAFVHYGPARAGRGFYRVDQLKLSPYLDREENRICIIATGFYCYSYEWLREPSFLCAELVQGEEVIAFTGGDGWRAYRCHEHLQRVQRYSGQRTFCEAYDYRRTLARPVSSSHREQISLTVTAPKAFIGREVPMPDGGYERVAYIREAGHCVRTAPDRSRAPGYLTPGEKRTIFPPDAWEIDSFSIAGGISVQRENAAPPNSLPAEIPCDGYLTLSMEGNRTGLMELEVECKQDTDLILTFDEILTDGRVDFLRMGCINAVIFRLRGGETYRLMTAEPYTFQYINVISMGGGIRLKDFCLRRVGFPKENIVCALDSVRADAAITRIYNAAVETFCQNTADIYMDCPSRERAGWLCDSFFTSRTEHLLTGESRVERAFLSNFLMNRTFDGIPEGMLPMCYPADDAYNGQFIPNWAMWFLLEAEEYLARTGDRALIDEMREHMYALLGYFRPFENGDGLLEDLDGWIFVEWSKCNDLVQNINYPTNMLYYRFKKSLASLYGDAELVREANALRGKIREKSRKGIFFCEHSVRNADGKMILSEELTETCQYYAFFMGVASQAEDPVLWKTMVNDFGPARRGKNRYPHIHPSNAFIGNYLRLDLLAEAGLTALLEENIRGYFDYMAKRTDTLWENDTDHASCNHGFASHVLVWLERLGYLKYNKEEGCASIFKRVYHAMGGKFYEKSF